jgi:hypothetical protein
MRPASIAVMSRLTSGVTEFRIRQILKEREVIADDDGYADLLTHMDPTSASKEAKIAAILETLNDDPSTQLDFASRLLVYSQLGNDDLEELNRILALDHLTFDSGQGQILPCTSHPDQVSRVRSELARLLEEIDPKLRTKYEGVFDAFGSSSKDALGQSVGSMRELLNDIIDLLGKGSTRKEKVRSIIMSGTGAELVDSLADTIDEIYAQLSSQFHREADWDTAFTALIVTEQILYFILRKSSRVDTA